MVVGAHVWTHLVEGVHVWTHLVEGVHVWTHLVEGVHVWTHMVIPHPTCLGQGIPGIHIIVYSYRKDRTMGVLQVYLNRWVLGLYNMVL